MDADFVLALFLIGVGLSVAGAGANLYEAVLHTPAKLNYQGRNYIASVGNVVFSFVCGPYIMLSMGLRAEGGRSFSAVSALIAGMVAFGWAFISGLFLVALYLAAIGA